MMVHVPGVTDKGMQAEQLTEFVDLFPTLAEAAGLPKVPLCPEDDPTKVKILKGNAVFVPIIAPSLPLCFWPPNA